MNNLQVESGPPDKKVLTSAEVVETESRADAKTVGSLMNESCGGDGPYLPHPRVVRNKDGVAVCVY